MSTIKETIAEIEQSCSSNILNNYDNVTYHICWYIISPTVYKKALLEEGYVIDDNQKIIIAETGVTTGIGISSLNIEASHPYAIFENQGRPNAYKMEMHVVEYNDCSLATKIIAMQRLLGYKEEIMAPFCIDIWFQGYDKATGEPIGIIPLEGTLNNKITYIVGAADVKSTTSSNATLWSYVFVSIQETQVSGIIDSLTSIGKIETKNLTLRDIANVIQDNINKNFAERHPELKHYYEDNGKKFFTIGLFHYGERYTNIPSGVRATLNYETTPVPNEIDTLISCLPLGKNNKNPIPYIISLSNNSKNQSEIKSRDWMCYNTSPEYVEGIATGTRVSSQLEKDNAEIGSSTVCYSIDDKYLNYADVNTLYDANTDVREVFQKLVWRTENLYWFIVTPTVIATPIETSDGFTCETFRGVPLYTYTLVLTFDECTTIKYYNKWWCKNQQKMARDRYDYEKKLSKYTEKMKTDHNFRRNTAYDYSDWWNKTNGSESVDSIKDIDKRARFRAAEIYTDLLSKKGDTTNINDNNNNNEVETRLDDNKKLAVQKIDSIKNHNLLKKVYRWNFSGRNVDVLSVDTQMDRLWYANLPIFATMKNISVDSETDQEVLNNDTLNRIKADISRSIIENGFKLNSKDPEIFQVLRSKAADKTSSKMYLSDLYSIFDNKDNIYQLLNATAIAEKNTSLLNTEIDKESSEVEYTPIISQLGYNNVYSMGNLLKTTVTIKGDPYWLGLIDYNNVCPKNDRQYIWDNMFTRYFMLNIRTALKHTEDYSGSKPYDYDIDDTLLFQNVYQVITTKTTFDNGKFVQSLEGCIVPELIAFNDLSKL